MRGNEGALADRAGQIAFRDQLRERGEHRAARDAELSLAVAEINAIIDEALVCHIGFIDNGAPAAGRCAFRWRLVDGLVLARSALRHSLHYRSVVLFGRGEAVDDPAADAAGLAAPALPPWLNRQA